MPELIFITESWLTADNTFIFQGLPYYSVHRCDRNDQGGGVVLLAHPSLRVVVPNFVIPACGMEVLVVDILLTSTIPIRFITVYCPPSSTAVNSLALCKFLQSDVVSRNKLLIILGDFNLPDINWTSWSSNTQNDVTNCAFLDAFAALHLCQLISFQLAITLHLTLFLPQSYHPQLSFLTLLMLVRWQIPITQLLFLTLLLLYQFPAAPTLPLRPNTASLGVTLPRLKLVYVLLIGLPYSPQISLLTPFWRGS